MGRFRVLKPMKKLPNFVIDEEICQIVEKSKGSQPNSKISDLRRKQKIFTFMIKKFNENMDYLLFGPNHENLAKNYREYKNLKNSRLDNFSVFDKLDTVNSLENKYLPGFQLTLRR